MQAFRDIFSTERFDAVKASSRGLDDDDEDENDDMDNDNLEEIDPNDSSDFGMYLQAFF